MDDTAFSSPAQTLSGRKAGFRPPGELPVPWGLLGSDTKQKWAGATGIKAQLAADTDNVSTASNSTSAENDSTERQGSNCSEECSDSGNPLQIGSDDVDTVMIQHLPRSCSRFEVLDAIAAVGFGEQYDFFYMPMSDFRRRKMQNFGYAFVGFRDSDTCSAFADAMRGYRFTQRNSAKSCDVVPAHVQGLSNNVEHLVEAQKMTTHSDSKFAILSMRL